MSADWQAAVLKELKGFNSKIIFYLAPSQIDTYQPYSEVVYF